MEDRPGESFVCTSVEECWEAVVNMVRQKIQLLRQCGGLNPLLIQVPEFLDGLQMFGLRSPPIIQVLFTSHFLSLFLCMSVKERPKAGR